MPRDEATLPGSNHRASPEFHSRNDDLRADWGRTREEYAILHRQLGDALANDDDVDLRLWDRRWADLCDVMDDRDYWRERYLRYHGLYLDMEKKMLSYREQYKYAAYEVREVWERADRLELELGRYHVAEAERAQQDAADAAQRDLAEYGRSLIEAAAQAERDIEEGERIIAEERRLDADRNLREGIVGVDNNTAHPLKKITHGHM